MKNLLQKLLAAALCLTGAQTTHAAPAAPALRIVVPYAAGGAGDLLARTLGEHVTAATGTPVVVDNRPGGGTIIGTQVAFNAPADGRQLLLVAASFVINPHLMSKLPFDPLKDFQPVTELASNPHVLLVSTKVPAHTLQEFIAWARARHGQANYASFGNGSSGHLGFELLKMAGKFDAVHIPYKGSTPAITDLLAGQVDAMLADLPQAIEQIKAGKVRAIAVGAPRRAAMLPDVPTFAESGLPGFESKSWYGLVVRSGTPPAQIAALHQEFTAALHDPAVRARLVQDGLDIVGSSPADFGAFMASESARYAKAVKFSGVKID